MAKIFTVTGTVKKFPQAGGWVYLPIKQTYGDLGFKAGKPKWGLVPATITLGKTSWKKSLLPFGDETLFIALSEKVRKVENVKVGDTVSVTFKLRA
jgi:hypothetical protein